MKEIAARVGLAHSTVSGIVDRLVSRGMLERRASRNDGRVSHIAVTRGVREFMAKKAPGLMAGPLARALERGTTTDRRAIVKGLQTLRRLIG